MSIAGVQNEDKINYFLEAKRQVSKSLFINETWVVPTILGCYLIYIVLGNHLMKNRKPLKIKSIMLSFNAFQIVYNFYMFYHCSRSHVNVYYLRNACHPMDPTKTEIWAEAFRLAHLFFISKLIDLVDTVFLVLRKKVQQITILHLYHHIGMVIITWSILKYYSGTAEQGLIVFLLNPLVHVVMYTYYFLSLMGPRIQKYLWWKKYVTQLQLIQFVIYFCYMAALLGYGCSKPKEISVFILAQSIIFFALFKDFYKKHYKYARTSRNLKK